MGVGLIPDRERVDMLIGQSDKVLLTVLEEREGAGPEEPNFVLTQLGPVASGGRVPSSNSALSRLKVVVEPLQSCDYSKLKQEISSLKETVCQYELQDEVLQPSTTDELTSSLVEPNIRVVNGRYEMPVPLKLSMLDKLSNNYENALKRTMTLRNKAMRNPELHNLLSDTFAELVAEGWMEPVGDCTIDTPIWYLPFFGTRTDKPKAVYDGAAMFNGMSLNQIVLAGENLLNNLVEVLIRFRLSKYACVADVSKCFFQVSIPSDQQNLFRIVWYKNNDLDKGKPQIFKFTRHVWGINSSPYVALLALKRLVQENPVNVSELTLNVIQNNQYMDDILFASDNLGDLETIARESAELFESRGFKLRKWIANSHAESILSRVSP